MAFIPDGSTVTATTQAAGTWTPSPSSGTWQVNEARYVRVGNICMCWAHVLSTSASADNSTAVTISGLPITSANVGSTNSGTGRAAWRGNWSMFGHVGKNGTTAYLSQSEGKDPTDTAKDKVHNSDLWIMYLTEDRRHGFLQFWYPV